MGRGDSEPAAVTTSASSPPSPREEDLRLLFESAPVPLVLTRRSDSTLLMVNRAAALAFEVDPEGVLGTHAAAFYARPADREVFLQALARDGRVDRMELELKTAGGRHLWASVSASLIDYRGEGAVLLGVANLTERIEAARALRESRQMLRLVLDTIPVRVFWKDRDSVYQGCNHLVAADSGLQSVDEIVGKTDFDLGYKEAAEFQADDRRVMESGRPKVYYEEPVTTAPGRVIWARTSKFPLRAPGGEVVGVLGIFEDITDRKEVEEDIRRLNAELERRVAERTAQLTAANKELESFSYSVSHDLRAPLRAIDGFSQALVEDSGDLMDQNARGHLHRVRLASQRMGQLIDDILDLSRTSRAELRRGRVSLSSLAEAIVAQLRASGPERRVEFVIEGGLEADADESLSRVLLENLLGNAWKYTSKKPVARIEFGRTRRELGPVFFVRDDGDGFDMAYAHKLFGAFQRLHGFEEFEGTGIGLATVRRIVERHGGKVWGEGQPGVGAVFYFSLGDEPARP